MNKGIFVWLALVVILMGCAQPPQYHNSLTFVGFPADQQALVNGMLDDLGQLQGHDVTITLDSALPSDIAGNDTGIGTPTCAININTIMFANGYQFQLEAVVWHEYGHCAGLYHDPDNQAIMYFEAQNFANYSEDEKTKFRNEVIALGSLIYNPSKGIGAQSLGFFNVPNVVLPGVGQ